MPLDTIHALRDADRVSASQLVRRFGHWQNVANERPVFVLHHGNPRWALMSMPLLSDLTDQADHDARASRLAALHDLTLDHMRVMSIVLDSELIVTEINAAARAHLSLAADEAVGRPLEGIVPPARRALLDENPDPSEHEIRTAISGGICRCTGYKNIVAAARWAAEHQEA